MTVFHTNYSNAIIAKKAERGPDFSLEDVEPLFAEIEPFLSEAADFAKLAGNDDTHKAIMDEIAGGAQFVYEDVKNNEYEPTHLFGKL